MKLQSTGDNPITIELNNDDDLYELLEIVEQLQERAAKIATAMIKLRDAKGSVDSEEIYFESGSIRAEYDEYLGCSEWATHGIDIPLSYFFDDSFIEDAKEQIRKRKEAEKRRREEAEAKRKKEAEERERQQYLKLKEKYGEND